MRGLLDTGCTKTLVTKQFANQYIPTQPQEYNAYGNQKFTTTKATQMQLKLVEFSDSKLVNFKCMVDTTTSEQPYDIILGIDFLVATGMDLNFKKKTITWDGLEVEMRKLGELQDEVVNQMVYNLHTQPILLKDIEERQARILDANYSQVDIDEMVDELKLPTKSK